MNTKDIRLYVNITNHCDANCPFCCMYSDSSKKYYMNKNIFSNILNNHKETFELQLEGGEPLQHPDLLEFIKLGVKTNRCKKVIILTNGLNLEKFLPTFKNISNEFKIPFLIKISYNYWLKKLKPTLLKDIKNYIDNYNSDSFHIFINCRLRYQDKDIKKDIQENNLEKDANIFYLQNYGKNTDSDYDGPVIVQNISNWFLYASDGTCFYQDLIARSEYENIL